MSLRQCCIINNDGVYVDLFSVKTEQASDGTTTDTVLGYKLVDGDRLIDTLPPTRKGHAGSAGFVKPRWDEEAKTWVEGATAEELAAWEAEHQALSVSLDALREEKQSQNKRALADWLAKHPLSWSDNQLYGVTEEDQNEMMLILGQYKLAEAAGQPAVLEWHSKKQKRRNFTNEEYTELSLAIKEYVDPYRRYLENIKETIYKAQNKEELDAIVIDYSSVNADV